MLFATPTTPGTGLRAGHAVITTSVAVHRVFLSTWHRLRRVTCLSSTMYDFCITPIYAALLAAGGLIGFVTKGSTASLGGGVGAAAVLGVCSAVSLQCYKSGTLCKSATALSLVVAAGLAYVMGKRYQATGKVMPAGAVAALSCLMVLFYCWSLVAGPQPKTAGPTGAAKTVRRKA